LRKRNQLIITKSRGMKIIKVYTNPILMKKRLKNFKLLMIKRGMYLYSWID